MIADAHSRGLEGDRVDDRRPGDDGQLHRLGVDGIITDYPNRLREVMADNGMRLPKPYPRTPEAGASGESPEARLGAAGRRAFPKKGAAGPIGSPRWAHPTGFCVIAASAAVLASVDLVVKFKVPTESWAFHHRSQAWFVLSVVVLVGGFSLALVRSRAVALAAGVMCGGVIGNLVSARADENWVPNPLVIGSYERGLAFNLADVFFLAGNVLLMACPDHDDRSQTRSARPAARVGTRTPAAAARRRLNELAIN